MARLQRFIRLHNGIEMPAIGFGCAFGNWTNAHTGSTRLEALAPEQSWTPISAAVKAGYRHFDTAYIYGTHRPLATILGLQFANGSVKREDLWVTTKVFHGKAGLGLNHIEKTMDLGNPDFDVKLRTWIDFERSLDELSMSYVDLLLMHWPGHFGSMDEAINRRFRRECWEVFEEIYASGRARAIGVSNFNKRHLETMIEDTTVLPMVNQLEISPYITQKEEVAYCQEKGIVLQAWGPLGSGATGILGDPSLKELARKYGKSVAQVVLRWLLQQGICALPKSSNAGRLQENLELFDFELSPEEMGRIHSLNKDKTSIVGRDDIP